MNPDNPPSITFSEKTATLETNVTVTFNYTQALGLDDLVTIALPQFNTDGVEVYFNSSCHFTASGGGSMVNLTVQGNEIPQDQQCDVLHGISNPQSARTIDNATISVPVAADGISLQPLHLALIL